MEKEKVLKALTEKPRHSALKKLFGNLPLFEIYEIIKKSNIKIALLDDNIRSLWMLLFSQKNKNEILSLLEEAIKKEPGKVIQMPLDDDPDEIFEVDITKFCFCPCCNNMVTKLEYGDEIDCPYCN